MNLNDVRSEYTGKQLLREDIDSSPCIQLRKWMQEAIELQYSNAATLSTVSDDGYPHSRIVLIKEIKNDSLIFYTCYGSKKSKDIDKNNKASFNIYWKEFDRQIRLTGTLAKTSREESETYFHSRPFESQVAALISPQSDEISIEELESAFQENLKKYNEKTVPMPNNWGGYLFTISSYEFWQGRPSRLHDRFSYTKNQTIDKNWNIKRLAP